MRRSALAQKVLARLDFGWSEAHDRASRGRRDRHLVGPNLWAGRLAAGRGGTALVGNPDEIVARMKEYQRLASRPSILSGYPHLEEAYRFAELVFPEARHDERSPVFCEHGALRRGYSAPRQERSRGRAPCVAILEDRFDVPAGASPWQQSDGRHCSRLAPQKRRWIKRCHAGLSSNVGHSKH